MPFHLATPVQGFGWQGWARTTDGRSNSAKLYQLSYLPIVKLYQASRALVYAPVG